MEFQDGKNQKVKFAQLYVDLGMNVESQADLVGKEARDKCTSDKIKQAFRKIALASHPDKSGQESAEVYMNAKKAHDILVNDKQRLEYNEFLMYDQRPKSSGARAFLKIRPFLNVAFQYVTSVYQQEEEKLKQNITIVQVPVTLEDLMKSTIEKELVITDEVFCTKCPILQTNVLNEKLTSCNICNGSKKVTTKTPIKVSLKPEYGCLDRNFNARVFSDPTKILQINWSLTQHDWFLQSFTDKFSQVNGIRPCDLVYIWKISAHEWSIALKNNQPLVKNLKLLDGSFSKLYISNANHVLPRQIWVARGQGLLVAISQPKKNRDEKILTRGNLLVFIDIGIHADDENLFPGKSQLVLELMNPEEALFIRKSNDHLFGDPQLFVQQDNL